MPKKKIDDEKLVAEFVRYCKEHFDVKQEGNVVKMDGLTVTPQDLLDMVRHFALWAQ